MNKLSFAIIISVFSFQGIAQVGVGTISPDPSSTLDVTATDKGVLIPRVSLADVSNTSLDGVNTAATGLLIYNTNATVTGGSGVGYYYFNGTDWEKLVTTATAGDDIDWYEEGTTNSPDDISDDKYTFGNLAIGKNTANYRLELQQTDNTATRTLSIYSDYADSGVNSNIYNENNFTGAGTTRNIYNLLGGSGDGNTYSIYNNNTNSGDGFHYGVRNTLSGTGTGQKVGTFNHIPSNQGQLIGVLNSISTTNGSTMSGIINNLSGGGVGARYGVSNSLASSGMGSNYGTYNQISGLGGGDHYATQNIIVNGGNGIHYGVHTELSGAGSGDKYGYYSSIANTAGGTHYGIYSSVLKTGSFAGYFLGDVAIGTTSADTYLLPASRGTVDQVMQTDASGNVSWVDPSILTGSLWNTSGNSGTDGGTNDFVGTTDAVPLMLRTNNVDRLRITTAGQIEPLNTNSSVYVGENSGTASTGLGNVHVGFNAGAAGTTGQYNTYIGYEAGRLMTNLSNNTFVGSFAGYDTDTGANNTFIGSGAGTSTTSGSSNAILGVSAGSLNDQGGQNVLIGRSTGLYNYDGSANTYLGYEAGFGTFDGTSSAAFNSNVFVGYQSGHNVGGSNNVFLGYRAGFNEIGSNKLYIESSPSTSPLIYGDFNLDLLQINGSLNINNQYTLPINDGTANQILQTDGSGNLLWRDVSTVIPVVSANNGLTLNATNVQLGGTLISDTRVSANTSQMIFNLNSTGDFTIEDNLTPIFRILDTGVSLIGDDMYWRDGNVLGTDMMIFTDDGNDGRLRILENGLTSIDLDANSQVVFNEQGLDRNFRIESDNSNSVLFVDAGLDNVGIKTLAPSRNLQVNIDQFTGATGDGGISIRQSSTGNEWTLYTSQSSNVLSLYYNNALRGQFDEVNGTYTPISDRRLKRNIVAIEPIMDRIMQLKPMKYHFKDQQTSEWSYGVIAQEIAQIFPELVKQIGDDTNGNSFPNLMSVSYSELVPILIKGTQEQQKQIESLEAKLSEQQKEIEAIKRLLRELDK